MINLHLIIDVLRNSVLITGLVIIMMLMIEYFNIQSHGKVFSKLTKSKYQQVILGALLGLIPGCIGGFAAVSLFTHRILSFGGLIAMMICSSGDEAFFIMAMIPQKALVLFGILLAIAIICGLIIDYLLIKRQQGEMCEQKFEIHKGHESNIPSIFKLSSYKVMLKPSKERIAILVGITLFIVSVIFGILECGHDHSYSSTSGVDTHSTCLGHIHTSELEHIEYECNHAHDAECNHAHDAECNHEHDAECNHEHDAECNHEHDAECNHAHDTECNHEHDAECNHAHDAECNHEHDAECNHAHDAECNHEHDESCSHAHGTTHSHSFNILNEKWINIVFAIISIITLFFTASAKEHFIKDHLWNHVIKGHLLSIFLWTFGMLIICQIGIQYLDIKHWINNNMLVVILLAVAIGIIPESGPHMVFVALFAQGVLPFYVLLVNSIVQDGHTTLPLLAQNKRAFLKAKLINIIVGLIIGVACWLLS